jgi:glycosyltransferase involved in cell wall biosynthesis
MRIALISSFYFPITGGPSTETFNLARALERLGIDVTIYTPLHVAHPTPEHSNLHVVRIPTGSSLRSKLEFGINHFSLSGLTKARVHDSFYSELSKILTQSDFDAIHSRVIWCHALETNPMTKPVRVMSFGTMPIVAMNPVYRWLMDRSFSEVDYRVAIHRCLVGPLWSLWGIRINRIIPAGVDVSFFVPYTSEDRDEFVIGAALKFAYAEKVAGLGILIRSFSLLRKRFKNLELLVAGDGPLREEVKAVIRSLPPDVRLHVSLIGELRYSQMPAFFNSLDLYCHISFRDAGPLAVLEAMSCGVPVLANDIGFVAEVVKHDVGWIVPPTIEGICQGVAKAIERGKDDLRTMGAVARKRVEDAYSWEKVAREYVALYSKSS